MYEEPHKISSGFTMASRNPQPGPPGLTKTQRLRQTRSATMVKEYEQKQETAGRPRQAIDVGRTRKYVAPEPKRVEFTKPTMTKAMMARVKHAEKVKQEYERKREEAMPTRRVPRRTPAPISGDPRYRKPENKK